MLNEKEKEWLLETFGTFDISEKEWKEKLKKVKLEYIKKHHPDFTKQPATEEFLLVNNKEKWEEFETLLEEGRKNDNLGNFFSGVWEENVWVDLDEPGWVKETKNGKTVYYRMTWS